jgi:hypothetical protein
MFVQAGGIISVSAKMLMAWKRMDGIETPHRRIFIGQTINLCVGQPCLFHDVGADDIAPDKRGNRVLISICSYNLALYVGTYIFYRTLNARRDKKWNALSAKVRRWSSFR